METEIKETIVTQKSEKFDLKDGLSVDEAKLSTVVVITLATFIYGGVLTWRNGDIPNNLCDLMIAELCIIMGLNGIQQAKEAFKNWRCK